MLAPTSFSTDLIEKFQEMSGGRTLSLPRRHHEYIVDGNSEVDEGFQKRPRSSRNLHASGTFLLHGTLRRNLEFRVTRLHLQFFERWG